jgi:dTDP-4-amino-4,6-dideoxygalactose transaminase
VPWGEFPEAAALKRRVLALPVHQGLGETEMEIVAAAFEAAWRLLA